MERKHKIETFKTKRYMYIVVIKIYTKG